MGPELEDGTAIQLDFTKIEAIAATEAGVIPVVAQDIDNGLVLMIGYANQKALDESIRRGRAVFWSTSRNELWIKGAGSGDVLELVEIRVNCEQNSLLYLVRPKGEGACHTKDETGRHRRSCYYRRIHGTSLQHAPYEPVWKH